MLEGVIGSKTKVNILVKLFLNPATRGYLRGLAREFGVSTNSIRTQLNALTEHGILMAEREGRSVFYRANPNHPLFPELSSMVRKITGIDSLLTSVIERLGRLEAVYVVGDYAEGQDTGLIDLVLVGDVDSGQLDDIVTKSERYIQRKIRSLIVSSDELEGLLERGAFGPVMKLWESAPLTRSGSNAQDLPEDSR